MCKYLGGWTRHLARQLKNKKLRLSSLIDELKALAKVKPLSTQEIELKTKYKAIMDDIM
jgi:hypothetical protein